MGRHEEGRADNQWRKRRKKRGAVRVYPKPLFTGREDVSGRTVRLSAAQGLGDTIQFCRYARRLAARGAQVVLAVRKPLCRLMTGLGPRVRSIGLDEDPGEFDFYAALMSLPWAFGSRRGTIPADLPYLAAEPARLAAWKARLGAPGFRVGICWQGSKKRIDAEQLASLPEGMRVEMLGEHFDAGPGAFLDTAAVMQHLDLVISSDTSIAHLAGPA